MLAAGIIDPISEEVWLIGPCHRCRVSTFAGSRPPTPLKPRTP
jgi:hypothetical protein